MTTSIRAESIVPAPPEAVWATLVDLSRYGEWNPFTPRIDASLVVGTPVVLHVAMRPGRPLLVQREVCTVNDAARFELGWGMELGAAWLLRARRIQRLTRRPDGTTHYETEDVFSGLLVGLVMALYGRHIARGFDDVAQALAARFAPR